LTGAWAESLLVPAGGSCVTRLRGRAEPLTILGLCRLAEALGTAAACLAPANPPTDGPGSRP